MVSFTRHVLSKWSALMVPAKTRSLTLSEREYERKRQLLSYFLLFSLSLTGLLLLVGSIVAPSTRAQSILGLLYCTVLVVALWLNRRGNLAIGSFVFLLDMGVSFYVSADLVAPTNPLALLWMLPPISLLIAMSGLFFSPAMIVLTAVIECVFLTWYVFVERHAQLTSVISPGQVWSFYAYLLVTTLLSTMIGIFYTTSTNHAIKKADRATELEQAQHKLSEAYEELKDAHTLIQKQALTDGLTGLANHRAVLDQLEKELERARRYGSTFSVVFLDGDRFKQVNDVHGHAAGDAVLQQISQRAGSLLRGGDTLGRFGGEEFVLLLPETDTTQALQVAERIRSTVAVSVMEIPESTKGLLMTVSLGVATYPTDGETWQTLLEQADAAMYLSKRLGRNQVRTAAEARQVNVNQDLRSQVRQAEQRELLEREEIALAPLRDSTTLKTMYSLLALLERRDPTMSQHAHMVSDLATALATALELDATQVARIGLAALVHDIGKVALPDLLLYKSGVLSEHEQALLRDHAMLGAQILEASPFLHDLMPAVRHHHERWDGKGYPDQLVGEDIPLAARIIAVAEAYDAMQRERFYQSRRTTGEARAEMRRWSGTQFDPRVVQALWKVLAIHEGKLPVEESKETNSQQPYSLSIGKENS